jgi:multiple sugar transport system ATP-binding protein
MQHADISELAADSGMEDLPSHGEGQQVVARLSAESKAAPGNEVELTIETTQLKLFATDSGRSMTAAAA